jgi:hypothetical protein
VGEFEFERKRGGVRRRVSSPGMIGFQIGLGFGGYHAHAHTGVRHSPTEDAESTWRHSSSLNLLSGGKEEETRYGIITSTRSESVCGGFGFLGWVCVVFIDLLGLS